MNGHLGDIILSMVATFSFVTVGKINECLTATILLVTLLITIIRLYKNFKK